MSTRKTLQALLVSGLVATTSQGAIAGGYHSYSHHGGHHGHGDGAALAAGLIIGGLFGYLLSEDRHSYRHYNDSYTRSDAYPRSHVVYRRVERTPTVITTERDSAFTGHDCMMTREYSTTLTINGIDKEAYGTRCMTADGGWVLGQPKLMPDL